MIPATDIPLKEPTIPAGASDAEQVERARIDASTRVPVLMFYASAMVWLLIGTFLGALVSFKLHSPDWLAEISFLTWGRLRPVVLNIMIYGWGSMAAMGTAIWLMARLCRTTLRHPLLIVAGACFWNIGVLIGVTAIVMGYNTGYEWLERRFSRTDAAPEPSLGGTSASAEDQCAAQSRRGPALGSVK